MSINKRKIVAYNDIEESADAKRLRYAGYNYGSARQTPSVPCTVKNEDDELGHITSAGEEHESLIRSNDEPTEQTTWQPPSNGHKKDRQRKQDRTSDHGPRADVSTGMRAFIPGLDDEDAASDKDEETVDALAYLRSVRYVPPVTRFEEHLLGRYVVASDPLSALR